RAGGGGRGGGRRADRGHPGRGPPGPAPLGRGPQAPGDRRRDALPGRASPLVVSRRRPPRAGDGAYAPTGGRPMPDGGPAVEVDGLSKTFGAVEAVRGIEFTVRPGEIFGFLGPHGAGKCTTITMLGRLLRPTGGRALVAGHDVVRERDDVRRNIGLVFQDTTLDGYLTGEQNLRFHAELYGVPRSVMRERMRQVLEMVGLWDRRRDLVQTYSGGMKRRLEIARGLLHSP